MPPNQNGKPVWIPVIIYKSQEDVLRETDFVEGEYNFSNHHHALADSEASTAKELEI